MDTQFSDDLNTIRADDVNDLEFEMEEDSSFLASEERRYREEKALFYGELESPEDVSEFEEWLDESMDGDHESALESVYGPND